MVKLYIYIYIYTLLYDIYVGYQNFPINTYPYSNRCKPPLLSHLLVCQRWGIASVGQSLMGWCIYEQVFYGVQCKDQEAFSLVDSLQFLDFPKIPKISGLMSTSSWRFYMSYTNGLNISAMERMICWHIGHVWEIPSPAAQLYSADNSWYLPEVFFIICMLS